MQFQQSNLPSVSLPWARQVEQGVNAALDAIGRGLNQSNNTNDAQSANLALMGQKLGNLQSLVNNLNMSASNITPGTFGAGVVVPASNIVGNIGNTLVGNASSNGTGVFNGGLYSTDAYSFNMSGTRVAGWHQIDGHIGTASSSRRFKTNIVDSLLSSPERAEALLKIMAVHYNYIAEVAKRDAPDSPDYVGPDFHVHTEVGMIAEDLHEAGFWEFVIYEHEPIYATMPVLDEAGNPELDADGNTVTQQVVTGDKLKLNEDGDAIPNSIHYEIFSVGVLAVTQYLNHKLITQQAAIDSMDDRISKLEGNS